MLNENTDRAKKKSERGKERWIQRAKQDRQHVSLSTGDTRQLTALFPHSVQFLVAQEKPNKRQEIKKKRSKNGGETEDGKKHS